MNNFVTYGQTFSKGQLTIPKKIRELYGLGVDFAYKITAVDQKIIIEPQEKLSQGNFAKVLSSITEPIFTDQDYQEWKSMRSAEEKRLKKLGL
jgi:bifunctional DNA-binding transcriptional regulator/antitoxin component of YhaV-PrlF toxin-antitoxin module